MPSSSSSPATVAMISSQRRREVGEAPSDERLDNLQHVGGTETLFNGQFRRRCPRQRGSKWRRKFGGGRGGCGSVKESLRIRRIDVVGAACASTSASTTAAADTAAATAVETSAVHAPAAGVGRRLEGDENVIYLSLSNRDESSVRLLLPPPLRLTGESLAF